MLVLDCIFVKVRENHAIINKAVYVAIGVNSEGYKDVLGLWLEKTEGAKFWLSVLTELKNRGVQDVLIACVTPRVRCTTMVLKAFQKRLKRSSRKQLCKPALFTWCGSDPARQRRKPVRCWFSGKKVHVQDQEQHEICRF